MTCPCTAIRSLDGLASKPSVGLADWGTFDTAVKRVIALEGGRVDHPNDPGGRTAYGITQRTYDAWRRRMGKPRADVWTIPEVEVRAIYYDDYCLAAGCWGLPAPLAVMHFDTAVNMGVPTAKRMLASAGGTVEGYDAARRTRRRDIIRRKPRMKIFERGWKRRDDAILSAATTARGSVTPPNIAATTRTTQQSTSRPEWA
jgi:hypothetical protein